ncbi:MAG: M23 family metallopeptidase [Candidatus Neomarinimicrobiota bacterium]|nr:M23 family metallopeptidase [Candidatus Neomarinimicrobiota bacterium]
MFRSQKNTNKYHNYIIVSEKNTGVRNYHFSRKFAFFVIGISVLSISTILFLSANALTGVLYEAKMNNLRSSYEHLSETLVSLQKQLDSVSGEVSVIEEKDQAIRTYAGLPQIDQDVRKLGVGGTDFKVNAIDDIPSSITNRITEIEMNVNALSRKVKLELNSYNSLYDVVRNHSDNLKFVPSIRPVQSGYINSNYGYREDPFNGKTRFHYGLDIAVNVGTKVYAPADGKIKFAGNQGGFGKVVKIDHSNGYRTIFAHLSKINVKPGTKVKRGDLIALTGKSGRTVGPHLHYEVHHYGAPQNPLDYFFSGYLK